MGERERVHSAFNGLGVYNVGQISRVDHRCMYRGRYDDGHPICEHVPFHLCLADRVTNASMFIDGDLVCDFDLATPGAALAIALYVCTF